jgi:hypothetical protein
MKPETAKQALRQMSGGLDLGTLYQETSNPKYTVPGQIDLMAVRKAGGPGNHQGRVSSFIVECKAPENTNSGKGGQRIMLDDLSENQFNTVLIVGLSGKTTSFVSYQPARKNICMACIRPWWFDPIHVAQIINRKKQKQEKCDIESFIYHWYRPWYEAADAGEIFEFSGCTEICHPNVWR